MLYKKLQLMFQGFRREKGENCADLCLRSIDFFFFFYFKVAAFDVPL